MPPRTHLPSPAQFQPSSYPVYTESPLRTVQLQSEVKTSRRRAPRSGASSNISRRNNGSILQNTIYDALGSSEPVDLLPHISKRAAPLHRGRSDTSLDESESPTPPAAGDEILDIDPMETVHSHSYRRNIGISGHRIVVNGCWIKSCTLHHQAVGATMLSWYGNMRNRMYCKVV